MGHLLEAIKKLEQRRVPEEPKPIGRSRSKTPRGKIQRVDKAHPIAALPRAGRRRSTKAKNVADLAPASAPELAPATRPIEPLATIAPAQAEITPAEASVIEAEVLAWTTVSALVSATDAYESPEVIETPLSTATMPPELLPLPLFDSPQAMLASPLAITPTRIWEISPPSNVDDYRVLAAYLFGQAGGTQRRKSLLLTAVSTAAIEAVSLPALAVALSTQGDVLWIDTQRPLPTLEAVASSSGNPPGWSELADGQATWEQAIVPTSLSGVSFTGSGTQSLAVGQEIPAGGLLERVPAGFSFVLVDGGLVDGSAELAASCESVALVVVIGHDQRGQSRTPSRHLPWRAPLRLC
jgi:Mrp family chromosome partitioning ATPase